MTSDLTLKVTCPALYEAQESVLQDGPAHIDAAIAHYTEELKQAMAANRDVVAKVETTAHDLAREVAGIRTEIGRVKGEVEEGEEHARTRMQHMTRLIREIREAESTAKALDIVAAVVNHFEALDDLLLSFEGVVEAAKPLRSLRNRVIHLENLVDPNDEIPRQISIMLNQATQRVLEHVAACFFDAVKFEQRELSVCPANGDLEGFSDLLTALCLLDAPETAQLMKRLSLEVVSVFLRDVLTSPDATLRCGVAPDRSASLQILSGAGFEPSADLAEVTPSQRRAIRVCRNVCVAMTFVSEHVFGGRAELMASLGVSYWTKMYRTIHEHVFDSVIPCSSREITSFAAVATAIKQLQKHLAGLHFISTDDTVLTDFQQEARVRFVSNLLQSALDYTRSLLRNRGYTLASGASTSSYPAFVDASAVELHRRVHQQFLDAQPGVAVSQVGYDVSVLLYGLMNEARRDASIASIASEVVHLFVALSPHDSITLVHLLQFSDSMLLVHHCVALVQVFGGGAVAGAPAEAPLPVAALARCLPRLAELAQNALQHQKQVLQQQCDHTLAQIDHLQHIESKKRYDDIVLQLTGLVRTLEQFDNVAKQVLPEKTVLRLLSQLSQRLMGSLTQATLSRPALPLDCANRTYAVLSIVDNFNQDRLVPSVLFPDDDDAKASAPTNCRFRACRAVFLVLLDLLHPDQSLMNLTRQLRAGELSALEPQQLASLVEALFEPSDQRSAFLDAVGSRLCRP